MVEAPRAQRRLYRSRAAHEEWDGPSPLSEDTSGKLSRCACSRRADSLRLGLFVRPRSSLSALLAAASALLASRVEPWDF